MRIDHFHFLCRDPERAASFFVKHFSGVHYQTAELPDWRILRVRVGDIVLAFSPQRNAPLADPATGPARGFDHIGITVSDLDDLLARLRQDDVEVVKEPTDAGTGTRIAYIRVPDAIQIELLQPLTRQRVPA
jgi:catechol 2,3-dioxygenase-like lactoylglutathione lyase family enzyme